MNQSPQTSPLERFLKFVIIAAASWYLWLCVLHLLCMRPLWNDELCVFQSIRDFDAYRIFHDMLMAVQVFPHFYLFCIQKFSQPFQYHLISLRFLPFAAMITAFFVWLKIAHYEFKNKLDVLTFILCWNASAVLIYYSAELKQYSMDVLSAALFILFIYNQETLQARKDNRYGIILALLPALVLFSYPAYFFLPIVFYNLVLASRENPEQRRYLLTFILASIFFSTISYCFDMRFKPVRIVDYWADYFISLKSIPEFFKTFGEGVCNLFFRWFVEKPKTFKKFGIPFAVIGIFEMVYGFLTNIRKDQFRSKNLTTIAFFIFVELVTLGALKKYPFTVPRTSLFFAPVVLVLIIKGITTVKQINQYAYFVLRLTFIAFLIFVSSGLTAFVLTKTLNPAPELWSK